MKNVIFYISLGILIGFFANPIMSEHKTLTLPTTVQVFKNSGTASGSLTFIEYEGKYHILTAYHVCQESTEGLFSIYNHKIYYLRVVKVNIPLHLCELSGGVPGKFLPLGRLHENDYSLGFPGPLLVKINIKYINTDFLRDTVIIPTDVYMGIIRHGMSGGPTLNDKNEVIGINMAVLEKINRSFIIPASSIIDFIKYG